MSFTPTEEQLAALELFKAGKSLVIQAGAGTGKTATLKYLAQSTNRRGQYLAFNRSIVEDSKRTMPRNVTASTIHSLAFRELGHRYKRRLDGGRRMRPSEVSRFLDLDRFSIVYADGKKEIDAGYLGSLVMRSINLFCQSADAEPGTQHVPYIDGIDEPKDGKRTYANNDAVRRYILPAMKTAWEDLQKEDGWLRFTHAVYLKLWERNDPKIRADFIALDESQDVSPVMMSVVQQQQGHAQIIACGDSQQSIYGFTGAVDAMEKMDLDAETYLTRSFRFGPKVADEANRILERLQAKLRLKGTDSIPSRVEWIDDPDCILTRTNAEAVSTVLDRQKTGHLVHLIGGGSEVVAFARGAQELMERGSTGHPELACFSSWGEVERYVSEDELGGELRLMVKLIDEYGVDTIIESLDRMTPENRADIVVSTAHKSKGREWGKVALAGDFPKDNPDKEELRLLYVAVTRARLVLDVSAVECLRPKRNSRNSPNRPSPSTATGTPKNEGPGRPGREGQGHEGDATTPTTPFRERTPWVLVVRVEPLRATFILIPVGASGAARTAADNPTTRH